MQTNFVLSFGILVTMSLLVFSLSVSVNAQQDYNIPEWIKNNALWWAQGDIGDDTYIQSLQYLILDETIILPPDTKYQELNEKIELMNEKIIQLKEQITELEEDNKILKTNEANLTSQLTNFENDLNDVKQDFENMELSVSYSAETKKTVQPYEYSDLTIASCPEGEIAFGWVNFSQTTPTYFGPNVLNNQKVQNEYAVASTNLTDGDSELVVGAICLKLQK